jgi:hypothetical protein
MEKDKQNDHPVRKLGRQLYKLHIKIGEHQNQLGDTLDWQKNLGVINYDSRSSKDMKPPERLKKDWVKKQTELKKELDQLAKMTTKAFKDSESVSTFLSSGMEKPGLFETDLRNTLNTLRQNITASKWFAHYSWIDLDLEVYEFNRLIGRFRIVMFEYSQTLRTVALAPRTEKSPSLPEIPPDYLSPVYLELNIAERSLIIGAVSYSISSPKVWSFLTTLASNGKSGRFTPRFDGSENWKNSMDMLRRQIGKDNLRRIVKPSNGGYYLVPSVKLKYSGQIGIRRTRQVYTESEAQEILGADYDEDY